jgi:hypothetical protein
MFYILIIVSLAFPQTPHSFVTVHCDPPYPHLFHTHIDIVGPADSLEIPLTFEMAPQWTDTVIINQELMTIPGDQIIKTKVDYTIVGGKVAYQREKSD